MNTTELLELFRIEAVDEEEPQLWGDAELFRYMDDAQKKFCRLTGGLSDASSALTQLYVTTGEEWLCMSPLILETKSAVDGTTGCEITIINREDMPKLNLRFDGRTGPAKYLILGLEADRGRVYPVPSVDSTIALVVDRLPLKSLTDEGQKIEIAEQHHQHLLKWMFHRAYSKQDAETFDRAKAAESKLAFESYCADAKRERERAKNKVRVVTYGG
jgi:hypothetical protein